MTPKTLNKQINPSLFPKNPFPTPFQNLFLKPKPNPLLFTFQTKSKFIYLANQRNNNSHKPSCQMTSSKHIHIHKQTVPKGSYEFSQSPVCSTRPGTTV